MSRGSVCHSSTGQGPAPGPHKLPWLHPYPQEVSRDGGSPLGKQGRWPRWGHGVLQGLILSCPAMSRDAFRPGWSPAATRRCCSRDGALQHRASLRVPGQQRAAGCAFRHAEERKVEVKGRFETQPPRGYLAPAPLGWEFSLLNPTAHDTAQPPQHTASQGHGERGQRDSRSQFLPSTPDGAGPGQTPAPADGRFCFSCSPRGSRFTREGPGWAVITSLAGVCIPLPEPKPPWSPCREDRLSWGCSCPAREAWGG